MKQLLLPLALLIALAVITALLKLFVTTRRTDYPYSARTICSPVASGLSTMPCGRQLEITF